VAVNFKKIARDIVHEDQELRVLALTTIIQLAPSSIDATRDEVRSLLEQLEALGRTGDGDVAFLARKALNHLGALAAAFNIDSSGKHEVPTKATTSDANDANETAAELVLHLSNDGPAKDVAIALSKLVKIGGHSEVSAVVAVLEHEDPRVRSNAIEFLERHADEKTILERLVPLLHDENNRVKGTVATALGRVGYPAVAGYLEAMAKDHRLSIRESAVYAMANIKGARMIDLLVEALRDPYEGIRLRAIQGLARHKDPRALAFLQSLRNDIDINVCEEAERAIAFISAEEAEPYAQGLFELADTMQGTPVPSDDDASEVVLDPSGAPRAEVVGTGGELTALRERLVDEYSALGDRLFARLGVAQTEVPSSIEKVYYESVRAREFLKQHRARSGSSGVRDEGAAETVARLESAVIACNERIARAAVLAKDAGCFDLTDELEVIERIQELEAKLQSDGDEGAVD